MTTRRRPHLRILFVCFALGCAARVAADEPASAQPVPPSAAASADPSPQPQVHSVAAVQAAPEPRFAIAPLNAPVRWQLVLAGLAAAVWVAHRRLRYWY